MSTTAPIFQTSTCPACRGKDETIRLTFGPCGACGGAGVVGCGCAEGCAGLALTLTEGLDGGGYFIEFNEGLCPEARPATPAEKAAHEQDAIGWAEPPAAFEAA